MLLAAQKVLGHMNGQDVFEQFAIISLQMLHILFLLCVDVKSAAMPERQRERERESARATRKRITKK